MEVCPKLMKTKNYNTIHIALGFGDCSFEKTSNKFRYHVQWLLLILAEPTNVLMCGIDFYLTQGLPKFKQIEFVFK